MKILNRNNQVIQELLNTRTQFDTPRLQITRVFLRSGVSVYRECLRHERASSSQLLPVSLQLFSLGQLLVILNQLVDLIREHIMVRLL